MTKRTDQLQALVDEHALMGMSDEEIKRHLRQAHSVDLATNVPPPRPMAQEMRAALLS